MIKAVIVHIIRDGRILLHYKKRGHGKGKWNGLGGKLERNESPEECAVREAREEMGASITQVERAGIIKFYDVNGEDWLVYVFRASIEGEPQESDESIPKWFPLNSIPYEEMWEDDKYWLPVVLNGLKFEAEFWFDGEIMQKFSLNAWKN
ncbi:ADP-ribose pyrophosphatase [Aciduliprofundum sp. MAR08-339]|uniref:8-oxo-dGTP diphosphatase n=1 Tax=Aciduliprofundum sp. (strain MAR08-339) TaxID=673860 RepID=UPI0002A4A3AB|nr:ADP-ribose pyrophosphatase [Aciduliprofundum sp. MAR08-339]